MSRLWQEAALDAVDVVVDLSGKYVTVDLKRTDVIANLKNMDMNAKCQNCYKWILNGVTLSGGQEYSH